MERSPPINLRPGFRQRFMNSEVNDTLSNSQADGRPSPRERHRPAAHRPPLLEGRQRGRLRRVPNSLPHRRFREYPQQLPAEQNIYGYPAYQHQGQFHQPSMTMVGYNQGNHQGNSSNGSKNSQEITNKNGQQSVGSPLIGQYGPNGYTAYIPYGYHVHPIFQNPHQPPVPMQQHFFPHNMEGTEGTENSTSSSSSESDVKGGQNLNEAATPTALHKFEDEQESSSSYEASKSSNTFSSNYSELSRATETSTNTGSTEVDFDANSLLAALGGVASNTAMGSGEINVDNLDWEAIAQRLPNETAASARKKWNDFFPKHKCTRLPHGVVIYCRQMENSNGRAHSSDGDNSGTRSSSYSTQYNRRGCGLTEPNSNESSGNNGNRNPGYGNNSSENSFGQAGSDACAVQKMHNVNRMNLTSSSTSSDTGRKKRSRRPWSTNEKNTIEQMQKKFGNKWTLIAETMNSGRTGTEVKNYWHNKKQKLAMRLLKQQE